MKREIESFLRRVRRDQRGIVMPLVAVTLVTLLGIAGLGVDFGYVVYVKSTLQASTDMAALAAGQSIPLGTAVATATTFSAHLSDDNALPGGVTVAVTPTLKCLTYLANRGLPCNTYGAQAAANAIVVTQTATVPRFFAQMFGFASTTTITASATASARGGGPPPLNMMIIVDTTASMGNNDASCTVPNNNNPTREDCAKYGVQVLIHELWPTVDQVGLMVFPGLTAATVKAEYCGGGSVTTVAYNASPAPVYQIISGSTDYRTSNTGPLNPSSNLVKALGKPGIPTGSTTCAGLQNPGGSGTYYVDVITAAQAALVASHKTGQQNVIVFVSDGASNAVASKVPTGKFNNQCHEAVTAAQAAAAGNATDGTTWVFSIAYGASTPAPGDCTTDVSPYSACYTMQQIASGPTKFYSDTSGSSSGACASQNAIGSLSSIFQNVGQSLLNATLIPNGTT